MEERKSLTYKQRRDISDIKNIGYKNVYQCSLCKTFYGSDYKEKHKICVKCLKQLHKEGKTSKDIKNGDLIKR